MGPDARKKYCIDLIFVCLNLIIGNVKEDDQDSFGYSLLLLHYLNDFSFKCIFVGQLL